MIEFNFYHEFYSFWVRVGDFNGELIYLLAEIFELYTYAPSFIFYSASFKYF